MPSVAPPFVGSSLKKVVSGLISWVACWFVDAPFAVLGTSEAVFDAPFAGLGTSEAIFNVRRSLGGLVERDVRAIGITRLIQGHHASLVYSCHRCIVTGRR